jgi:hypothetical protein
MSTDVATISVMWKRFRFIIYLLFIFTEFGLIIYFNVVILFVVMVFISLSFYQNDLF